MASTTDIENRVARASGSLTEAERRVALVVNNDLTTLAFDTVAELADRVGTSGPTIVRFAVKLGFDGYGDLQAIARASLSERLKRPTERIRRDSHESGWDAARSAALVVLDDTFQRIDSGSIREIAEPVSATTGTVWIVASETSSPVAQVLASNLRLARTGVRHLTGSTAAVAATIVDARSPDVLIAIDFARYERSVVRTARRMARVGVTVVSITDGPLSPLAELSDHWVGVAVPAVGPFDSAQPVLAVVEAVTADVAQLLRQAATARLDDVEASWSEHDVFD